MIAHSPRNALKKRTQQTMTAMQSKPTALENVLNVSQPRILAAFESSRP